MTKLEELKAVWENTLEAYHNEEKANKAKVATFIQGLTDKKLNVRANVRDKNDIYISVDFVGPDGKDDFASDFDISYRGEYNFETHKYSTPEIAMDCGSSGLSTRRAQPFKVERCHLMSAIWNHENELVDLLNSLQFTCAEATDKARSAYNSEKCHVEQQARDELKAKVLDTVKVGFTFTEESYSRNWNRDTQEYEVVVDFVRAVTITKITPKRVYLEWSWVTENESQPKYDRTNGTYNYIGSDTGHINHTQTGYMPIDRFISYRQQQFEGDNIQIALRCDGKENKKYEFVKTGFRPVEEK